MGKCHKNLRVALSVLATGCFGGLCNHRCTLFHSYKYNLSPIEANNHWLSIRYPSCPLSWYWLNKSPDSYDNWLKLCAYYTHFVEQKPVFNWNHRSSFIQKNTPAPLTASHTRIGIASHPHHHCTNLLHCKILTQKKRPHIAWTLLNLT